MNSQRQNKGVVVCVGPRAAEEGAKVLEAGGNAFDAAVTTAFVQMVVLPFACGVGGMASAHLWKADTRGHQVIDGCLRAGSLVTEDMWAADFKGMTQFTDASLFEDFRSDIGYMSVCTPGTVAAFAEMHRLHCSMPWSDLLQPAIDTARRGFAFVPTTTSEIPITAGPYSPDPVTRIHASPDAARLYFRAKPTAGEQIVTNPEYARTLERLAAFGAEDFYRGELASAMAEDLSKNGSFVTLEDIRAYKATSYTPRYADYGDYRVYTNASPGGGPLLAEALNVLDGVDLTSLDHGDVEYISRVASTLQLVQQDRRDYLGDPEAIGQESEDVLWSTERAATLRKGVLEGVVGQWPPESESPDTTHMTAVDADGNIACITHSLGSSSNVITPGLGFVYNDGMNRFDPRPGRASSIAPRKARLHMMMPSIAFRDGEPEMAVGAPGGNKILSALAQVIANVADRGMTAVEAVSAPRIHAEGSTVWCEARTRADTCDSLSERGYDLVHETQAYAARASAQLVILGPDGHLDGGSDPRSEGAVVYARK